MKTASANSLPQTLRPWSACAALILVILGSGCAVGRKQMSLRLPPESGAVPSAGAPVAVIDKIQDQRVFKDDPSDPSTPSLRVDIAESTPEERHQAIGRLRNAYGKAMGDIALEDGRTVEQVMRDVATHALAQAGYRVSAAGAADAADVEIDIKEFWAWFSPGFWSITIEARLTTDVEITARGRSVKINVSGAGKVSGQGGFEHNWQDAYEACFADWTTNLVSALREQGMLAT